MSQGIHSCKNPECKNTYTLRRDETDDGFCCFICWEKVNCAEPEKHVDSLNLQDILVTI